MDNISYYSIMKLLHVVGMSAWFGTALAVSIVAPPPMPTIALGLPKSFERTRVEYLSMVSVDGSSVVSTKIT